MANTSSLLDEEKIDENLILEEFYQQHNDWLKTIYLSKVPFKWKYEIAILFFITTKDPDWKEYLEDIGLKKMAIYGIDSIQCDAPPLLVAFNLMHSYNLGQVMELFAKKKKFHILRHMKPFVESLLEERNLIQPTAPQHSETFDTKITEQKSKENISSQQAWFSNTYSCKPQKFKVKLPTQDTPILVFIQHAMSDKKSAIKLGTTLQRRGFKVLLSADVFPFLRLNSAQIIRDLIKKVDFIVPLLSDDLWKQIYSKKTNVVGEDGLETVANRFVYDLALNEYFNNLKNYRVRPMLDTCKISVSIGEGDPILSRPFHLHNEVSQLMENLEISKRTKQKIRI